MTESDPRAKDFADPTAAANAPETSETTGDSGDAIDFLELAHGRREVLVRLAGQTYRLRWTRNDKLILTK